MTTSFDNLLDNVRNKPRKTVAVAMADEHEVLAAVDHAHREGIIDAVLVGDKAAIIRCGQELGIDVSQYDIVEAENENESVVRAIQLVRERLADTLMKGRCSSATLLKGVLDKQHDVRTGKLLSHCAVMEIPRYNKLLFMSDGGMNIYPDLDAKIGIIDNAVSCARMLGIEMPKVALIAAIEKVNYKAMPCTMDAAVLTKMNHRGQIQNCIVDGPLALDNAISKEACEIKGIESPVGGDADVLVMPNIEAGNVFYKALSYFAKPKTAGIVLGARVPIIMTSRADSQETKFLSIATGMAISGVEMI